MSATIEDLTRIGHTVDYWAALFGSVSDEAAITVVKPALEAMSEGELRGAVLLLVKARATARKAMRELIPEITALGREAGMPAEEIAAFERQMQALLA